jgi:hypothetical protein
MKSQQYDIHKVKAKIANLVVTYFWDPSKLVQMKYLPFTSNVDVPRSVHFDILAQNEVDLPASLDFIDDKTFCWLAVPPAPRE